MVAVTDEDVSGEKPKLLARHVAAVAAGNALEFYDFLTFSYFAVYIGHTFFPFATGSNSLLFTLITFGVGFLTRPLGGIVIGNMGDRIGRRPAMVLSFTLMGLGVIGLALTPSYAQIGMAAPVLVVLFRLLQGFALGGEVGPSTAFLVEAAPPERRGFYGSLQYMTQDTAVLAAGIVGTVLASILTTQQLTDWGWRVAFLMGAVIVPFGIIARRNLPETHTATTSDQTSRWNEFKPYRVVALLGLLMLMGGTIATYVGGYMTTYAIDTLHMPANISFGVNIVLGVCAITFQPLSGYFSDIFGRKPLMIIFGILLVVATVPAFWVISTYRTTFALYSMAAAMSILLALSATPVIVALTESIPARIRSGTISIIYAVSIAIFGGSAQPIVKWLIENMSNSLAPAWYMAGAYSIAVIAMLFMRETAPRKLKA